MKFLGVTILQGVEFSIFPIDFEWALQQCSATALPVISQNLKRSFDTKHKSSFSAVIYHSCASTHLYQIINQHTTFEVHSFSHSKDLIGGGGKI